VFFFEEITRFEQWNRDNTPIQKTNSAYAQAGYSEISDYFGNNLTLNNLSKGVFSESDLILTKNVVEVYTKIQLLAQLEAAGEKYRNIINQ